MAKDRIEHRISVATPIECTCYACPTQFEFSDFEGDEYYFRLRHGGWRLENTTKKLVLCRGKAPDDIDGYCSIEEMIDMVKGEGYLIHYEGVL